MSIPIPSFRQVLLGKKSSKPRLRMLEVRDSSNHESEAIGWVMVECTETYHCDKSGEVWKAEIQLSYQRIFSEPYHCVEGGEFVGCYSRINNLVSLTSSSLGGGGVFLDLEPPLKGQRVGSYLMNEIVQWVQQWPEAVVSCIELEEGQADDENRERRNKLYEQFGLTFDYDDTQSRRTGRSRPMCAGALTTVEKWRENITEHWVYDYLTSALASRKSLEFELLSKERHIKQLVKIHKDRESSPLRWALTITFQR